jgi:hypothetical protein
MSNGTNDTLRWILAALFALAVVGSYVAMVVILWDQVDSGEVEWSRKVLLFTGVETIAFAAVGWVFGREVNRGAAAALKGANSEALSSRFNEGRAQGRAESLANSIRALADEGVSEAATYRAVADKTFPE